MEKARRWLELEKGCVIETEDEMVEASYDMFTNEYAFLEKVRDGYQKEVNNLLWVIKELTKDLRNLQAKRRRILKKYR